jgi:hypothetical protein
MFVADGGEGMTYNGEIHFGLLNIKPGSLKSELCGKMRRRIKVFVKIPLAGAGDKVQSCSCSAMASCG